jgi:hypothetical protein
MQGYLRAPGQAAGQVNRPPCSNSSPPTSGACARREVPGSCADDGLHGGGTPLVTTSAANTPRSMQVDELAAAHTSVMGGTAQHTRVPVVRVALTVHGTSSPLASTAKATRTSGVNAGREEPFGTVVAAPRHTVALSLKDRVMAPFATALTKVPFLDR